MGGGGGGIFCEAATIKYIVYSNTKQDFMEWFH